MNTSQEFFDDFLRWIAQDDEDAIQVDSEDHHSRTPAERVERYFAHLSPDERSRAEGVPQLARHLQAMISA